MNKVLIVEDFSDIREWLVSIVNEVFPEFEILQAANLAEARSLSEHKIFLALVDLNLPDGHGVDFIRWLIDKQPNAYIIVATIYDDEEHLFEALKAGAQGYLLKGDRKDILVSALKGVMDGQPPLSPAIARMILRQFKSNDNNQQSKDKTNEKNKLQHLSENDNQANLEKTILTEREEQVLNFVAKGFSRNEVAEFLGITAHTAASHIKNIYRKLNVGSKAEAALEAKRLGLT